MRVPAQDGGRTASGESDQRDKLVRCAVGRVRERQALHRSRGSAPARWLGEPPGQAVCAGPVAELAAPHAWERLEYGEQLGATGGSRRWARFCRDQVLPRITDVALAGRELEAIRGRALPVDSASMDHVFITWTMSAIPDVEGALGEIRRVLRPGGELHFAEHGRSPEPKVARRQDRLSPVQR